MTLTRVRFRRPGTRILLLSLAAVVAALAAFGPNGSGAAGGQPSAAVAMDYITSHRLDLGAPGIAVGVVTTSEMSTQAAGDVTVDTPVPIGSLTKSVTALSVMQLIEAGKASLDEPVVKYLPDFATANPDVSDKITIRQLLSHTSGIPTSAGTEPFYQPQTSMPAQVEALRRVKAENRGSFAYSNANYVVLGDLVERLSGQTYAAYLHAHVLDPLEMTHTYTDLAAAQAGGLKDGHRIWFGWGVPTGVFYRADFLSAGFLVSTVGDLNHYMSAMLDGGRYRGRSILSSAGVATLLSAATPAPLFGVAGGYGFGWYHRPTGGLDLIVDPGIAQNVHADLVLNLQTHVGLVLLANAESDLYLATVPKFDLAALNATSLAAVGTSPQGLVEGLYVVYDLLVLAAVLWYARTLAKVLRRRVPWYPRRWHVVAFTLWRELLVPVAILVRLPALYGERWSYLITGDVGLAAAVVATLGLLTLTARLSLGAREGIRRSPRPPESPLPPSPQAHPPVESDSPRRPREVDNVRPDAAQDAHEARPPVPVGPGSLTTTHGQA